jgi:hypothetical protein
MQGRYKEVDKTDMKRIVMMTVIKIIGEAILIAVIAGILIGVIGYLKKWDTSLAYSNAFFIAGCMAIIAGASSRLGAGQDWKNFQLITAESFRGMSGNDQANFIINASSSFRLVILGFLSGILLIIISVIVPEMF